METWIKKQRLEFEVLKSEFLQKISIMEQADKRELCFSYLFYNEVSE